MQSGCIWFFLYLHNIKYRMKKQFQNIITYMLISISLSIILHSVIPHDHHYSTDCDAVHHQQKHNNTNKNPDHCYFFNEIIIDYSFNNLKIEIQKFVSFDVYSIASSQLQSPFSLKNPEIFSGENILHFLLVYTCEHFLFEVHLTFKIPGFLIHGKGLPFGPFRARVVIYCEGYSLGKFLNKASLIP